MFKATIPVCRDIVKSEFASGITKELTEEDAEK